MREGGRDGWMEGEREREIGKEREREKCGEEGRRDRSGPGPLCINDMRGADLPASPV